jgi:hypothetical protein
VPSLRFEDIADPGLAWRMPADQVDHEQGIAGAQIPGTPLGAMLTIFAVPKPFQGHVATIQRNAIASWRRLTGEVILFGNEEGIGDAARELGVRHVPEVARNRYGTPLLDDVFRKAELLSTTPVLVYANADVILREDFARAVSLLPRRPCLLVGRRWNLDLTERIDFDQPDWSATLERRARDADQQGGKMWLDYFAFRAGTLGEIPPFAVGRPYWDNWLLWRARSAGAWVIDGSLSLVVIHQNHDYGHVPRAAGRLWYGPEADENLRLAEDGRHGSLADATHCLWRGRVVRKKPNGMRGLIRESERLPTIYPALDHEPDFVRRFTRPRCKVPALSPVAYRWYASLNRARVLLIPVWRRLPPGERARADAA